MTIAHKKVQVGLTLAVLFLMTLVTGIILHLKKHGIIMEPRYIIKLVHCIFGVGMIILGCWHMMQFRKVLSSMKSSFRWFWYDTVALVVFAVLAFVTGAVKLLSPIKIPNLGMWHYVLGIAMAVFVFIHLVRGVPAWIKMNSMCRKHN